MSARLFGVTSVLALVAAVPALAEMNFNRVSTFATPDNMGAGEDRARVTRACPPLMESDYGFPVAQFCDLLSLPDDGGE